MRRSEKSSSAVQDVDETSRAGRSARCEASDLLTDVKIVEWASGLVRAAGSEGVSLWNNREKSYESQRGLLDDIRFGME